MEEEEEEVIKANLERNPWAKNVRFIDPEIPK
jgi:hypothetical protein